jgi:hypothetical protein
MDDLNLSNIKVLTKWDSKGSHNKRSILVLWLSIYLQIYINKTHSLEVSKKRNTALMTASKLTSAKHTNLQVF